MRSREFEDLYIPEPNSGCWLWLGEMTDKGYGKLGKLVAHRVSYEMTKGPIPEGLVTDHLCRNRICVNPDHLEAVTNKENVLRGVGPTAINAAKTHCPKGHEFTPENTHIRKHLGWRTCRTCNRERLRVLRAALTVGDNSNG